MIPSEESPLVGVITRTKDRPELLARAVQSVLGQSYSNWEHIIVNDGGEREPVEQLIRTFEGAYRGRVKVLHNPRSLEMGASSNIGIDASAGIYIAIHDDDDTWQPEFLRVCIGTIREKRARFGSVRSAICHANLVVERFEDSKPVVIGSKPYNNWIPEGILSLDRLLCSNMFPPISFVFERDAWVRLGRMREDLFVFDDWEFYLRCAMDHDIWVVPEGLANWHQRPSATGALGNSVIANRDMHLYYFQVLKNEWLRRDLREGRFGPGVYINLRWHIENLLVKTQSFRGLRAIWRWLRRSDS